MVGEVRISGTIVNSYVNCPREAWLQAHKIIPFQDDELLEMGRLINENAYARDMRKIILDNIEIDLINGKEGNILIGEVKKSSKSEEVLDSNSFFTCMNLRSEESALTGFFCSLKRKSGFTWNSEKKK